MTQSFMSKKLTKSQLYTTLSERTEMSKKDVTTFMEALTNLVYDEVKSSGEITLPGIGKLVKKDRAARMGRNPATGEQIHIPAKVVVKFRVAKAAKDSIL
jgi:DNA-binding protein HU-beta